MKGGVRRILSGELLRIRETVRRGLSRVALTSIGGRVTTCAWGEMTSETSSQFPGLFFYRASGRITDGYCFRYVWEHVGGYYGGGDCGDFSMAVSVAADQHCDVAAEYGGGNCGGWEECCGVRGMMRFLRGGPIRCLTAMKESKGTGYHPFVFYFRRSKGL